MRSQRQAGLNPFNLAHHDMASFAALKPPTSMLNTTRSLESESRGEHVTTRGLMLDVGSDNESATARTPRPADRGSRLISCGGAFAIACLCSLVSCALTAFFVGFAYPSPMSTSGVASTCGKDTPEAARARSLTNEFLTAQRVNDLDHLRRFFTTQSIMNINLDNAGFILGMRIRNAVKVSKPLIGPDKAIEYFESFPSEKEDPPVNVEALVCSGNVCTNTAVVSRNLVGSFKEVSMFYWDFSAAEISRMDIRITAA